MARFVDNVFELRVGSRELVLPQGRAGSGARYTEGKTVFWNKGKEATLDTANGILKQCQVTDRG